MFLRLSVTIAVTCVFASASETRQGASVIVRDTRATRGEPSVLESDRWPQRVSSRFRSKKWTGLPSTLSRKPNRSKPAEASVAPSATVTRVAPAWIRASTTAENVSGWVEASCDLWLTRFGLTRTSGRTHRFRSSAISSSAARDGRAAIVPSNNGHGGGRARSRAHLRVHRLGLRVVGRNAGWPVASAGSSLLDVPRPAADSPIEIRGVSCQRPSAINTERPQQP